MRGLKIAPVEDFTGQLCPAGWCYQRLQSSQLPIINHLLITCQLPLNHESPQTSGCQHLEFFELSEFYFSTTRIWLGLFFCWTRLNGSGIAKLPSFIRSFAKYGPGAKYLISLPQLARSLLNQGPHKIQPSSRRVRVTLNHTYIVDTTRAVHVWEHARYPQFYVPVADLMNCSWKDQQEIPSKGEAAGIAGAVIEITVPGGDGFQEVTTNRALRFSDDEKASGALRGLVRLEFGSMGKKSPSAA
jgi:hypothetical protein